IRHALGRGTHVITSSKAACAAAAVELLELARRRRVQCRMESTVMSGTPVLSTIREGLAGTRIAGIRGILNGTANHILTLMAQGLEYPAALADAQARGYAESGYSSPCAISVRIRSEEHTSELQSLITPECRL